MLSVCPVYALINKIIFLFVCSALNSLNGYRSGPAAHLISVLFGNSEPGMLLQQSKSPFFIKTSDKVFPGKYGSDNVQTKVLFDLLR